MKNGDLVLLSFELMSYDFLLRLRNVLDRIEVHSKIKFQ